MKGISDLKKKVNYILNPFGRKVSNDNPQDVGLVVKFNPLSWRK